MRILSKILLVIALAALIFTAVGCKSQNSSTQSDKPVVIVSIAPYGTMVEQIAGDTVQVEVIVLNGSSPHSFEPAPKDVQHLKNAKVWFVVGEAFENSLTPTVKDHNKEIVIYDLREHINRLCQEEEFILGHHHHHSCMHEGTDLHLWLSPMIIRHQVDGMTEILIQRFPENREMYLKNSAKLQDDLSKLHEEVKENMEPFYERVIVVSHPAFGYFCQEYMCIQIPVEVEGKDPAMKHIAEIIHTAEDNDAILVIAMPQYNDRGAKLIAKKLNLPLVTFDPYAPQYMENIKELSEILGEHSKKRH